MLNIFRSATGRSIIKFYAARDAASCDYQFEFRELPDGTWRAYILRQPASYLGRADGPHETHRLSDSHGRYVCWDRPLRSLDEAKGVAAAWAEATQRYRRTGERF